MSVTANTYTAQPGQTIICDGTQQQTITLPTSFSPGDQIAIVRGINSFGRITVVPGTGATISGVSSWINLLATSGGYVSSFPGSGTLILLAISSTLWVPLAATGFFPSTSGWSQPFNDIDIHGTLYPTFNIVNANIISVSSAATVHSGSIVILATGTGGYTLTADTTMPIGLIVWIKNNSSGNVTFAPNGTGTIDGASTLVLSSGTGALLMVSVGGTNANWTRLL